MKGSLSVSILSYLDLLKTVRFLSTNKFYLLLLLFFLPISIVTFAVATIAAPQKISQVAPGVSINRPTLKLGSQGERVSELQAALKLLGFYTGAVDGNYSSSTASAVSRFKQAAGLNPDGIVDTITWQRLFPSPPVTASTLPAPKPTPNLTNPVIVPTQSNNINRTLPQPEPRPAQPRQTTTPKPQTTPVRPATTSTTTKPRPAQTRTPQIPKFERSPGIQYTAQGLPILRLGNRGSEVRQLQEVLKKLGFLSGDIDGDFGPTTEAAVKAAQKRYGLEADGVAGGSTWDVLLGRLQQR